MIDDLMRPMTNAGDIVINAAVKFNDTQLRAASERAASSVQRAFSSRNPLGTYTTDFKHFQQAIEAATSRVTAFGLTAGVFFTVKRALVGLVESTIQVEKGLTNINVILNLSTRNLKTFSEDLFKVTAQTGQTFDTAAKAAAEFSRQGLGVEQTLKRTRDALILSRMAGLDAMTAVSDLTAAMNSFSDSILDSTQLISKFIAVDQRFAVSSADIAEAIKRVGSTAQDAGIDVDKLIGIITALQETTARGGAVIGQSLKTIFTRLTSPETVGVLEDFNIKVKDLNNNLLPTFDILTNIVNKFNQLGQSDRLKIESKIGNLYQINQLKALLKDLQSGKGSTAAEAESISRGAGNEALIRNEQFNQTLSAQLNRTAQNLKLTFSKLGENILGPNLKSLLGAGNSFLEGLNDSKGVEGLGTSIGKSILKGIGDSLLVGATYIVFALGKIFLFQFGKISQAFRSILDFGAFTKQTALETNTALQSQASTTEKLVSAASQRLAVERETLGVIQAQNAFASKSGGISSLVTRSMFPGSGSGFTGLNSNTNTLNPPIPSLAGTQGRASIMGKMGVVSRKLSDSSKLLLDPNVQNDPQMLRIINEERKISQTELGSLRNQLAVIDASQRQRNESLKDINRVKNNYIASRFTTQREQSYAREAAGRAAGASITQGLSALDERSGFGPGIASIDALRARRESGVILDKRGVPVPNPLFTQATTVIPWESAHAMRSLSILSPEKAKEAAAIRNQRVVTGGMLTSFAAPIMGNFAADAFFGGEGMGNRMGRTMTAGIGNIIGGAGMGLALGGGNPLVGAIGGVLGGLTAMLNIFREMRDVLPEVNARLDIIKDSIARGEERLQSAYKLSEQAEGFTSGRVSKSPSNVSNFNRGMMDFGSSLLTIPGLKAGERELILQAVLTGNPEALNIWKNRLSPTSNIAAQKRNTFIGQAQLFSEGKVDKDSFLGSLGGLTYPSGDPLTASLGNPYIQKMFEDVQIKPSGPRSGPSNFRGLLDYFRMSGASDEEVKSLGRKFQDKPQIAETMLGFLKGNPGASSGALSKFWSGMTTPSKGVNRSIELENVLALSNLNARSGRTLGGLDFSQSVKESHFATLQARNQAALARAGLTMNPVELAAMQGGFAGQDILGKSHLLRGDLNISTGGKLLEGIGGFRSKLTSGERIDQYGGILNAMEGFATGVAKDQPGSMDSFHRTLIALQQSMLSDSKALTEFKPDIDKLKDSVHAYYLGNDKLTESTKSQKESLDILTNLNKELATPTALAAKSLNDYLWSLQVNQASFEAMKNAGLLFSDQEASGNLSQRVTDISTGKLGGSGLTDAMTGSFTDQLKYNVKDMYRELVQGAAEVGASLKSSFKDAFVTFLDGSQSASDALRSLGLSFASKLLDIAAQGTTNMLFGSLANLGSAAYTGFTKGAMGGYVTGGSGIRDDVPAMLAEGDFVLRKSAVTKYGVGNLNRLNFASGGANITPTSPLSNFALSDENNPQNQLRMEKEANDLNALLQYTAAKQAFDSAKKQRRLGALINLGIGLGAAGISYGASQWSSGSHRGVGSGIDAPSGYGSNFQNYAASGGLMTSHGVQRLANGGSVDNVPALLMGGEFVMNRNAVSRHGVGFMHRLNRGEVPGFADGGFVGETIPNGSGRGNSDSGLNDSISRLINSNEKLRTSMEKGVSSEDLSANQGNSQPLVGSISINVYSDSQGDTKAETKTEGGTAGSEKSNSDKGAQLGQLIQATVLDVINKQSRNGGILEQNFQRKR